MRASTYFFYLDACKGNSDPGQCLRSVPSHSRHHVQALRERFRRRYLYLQPLSLLDMYRCAVMIVRLGQVHLLNMVSKIALRHFEELKLQDAIRLPRRDIVTTD